MTFLALHERSFCQRQVPTSRCPQSPTGRRAAADGPRRMLPMGNKIKTLEGSEAGWSAGSSVPCPRVSSSPPEMSLGSNNPLSGLGEANTTPVKITLLTPHTFRGKEGLYSSSERDVHQKGLSTVTQQTQVTITNHLPCRPCTPGLNSGVKR